MEPQLQGNGFVYLLVDVQSSLRYCVEARGVRSETHVLRVTDRPGVERIDLTYNFPSYAGMKPQVVENEGDISALKGTRVDLNVHLTQPADSAQIILDDGSKVELARTAEVDLQLDRRGPLGFYRDTACHSPSRRIHGVPGA
jgi:hypothetical protein